MSYLTIAIYNMSVKLEKEIGNHGVRQRITEQLKQYWELLKGERIFPNEADIDVDAIKDIWDSCFLVKYDANMFSHIYLGQELLLAYGDDFYQREICEKLVFPSDELLLAKFNQVLQNKNWVEYDDEFTNSEGLLVRHRSIILPLGSNDKQNEIGFLLGGMRWKAYL